MKESEFNQAFRNLGLENNVGTYQSPVAAATGLPRHFRWYTAVRVSDGKKFKFFFNYSIFEMEELTTDRIERQIQYEMTEKWQKKWEEEAANA